jgi:hypothetical protein
MIIFELFEAEMKVCDVLKKVIYNIMVLSVPVQENCCGQDIATQPASHMDMRLILDSLVASDQRVQ